MVPLWVVSSSKLPKDHIGLQSQPKVRLGLEGIREPQRHFGGNSRFAVENPRRRGAGDTQVARYLRYAALAQVISEDPTGVGWLVHLHSHKLLVIVLVVHEDGVLALKSERQPPVSVQTH